MKKIIKKSISLFLSTIMVISAIPLTIYAAEADVTDEVQVAELEDCRDIYSKTFETNKGTNVVITSAAPLHYEENGEMKEIDNTLVQSEKDSSALTNKSSAFSVELPKKYSDDSEISLEYQGDSISFKLVDEDISRTKGKTEKSEEVEVDKNDSESVAYSESNMDKLSSSITYENVLDNTDIEYNVNPDSLKESIILEAAPEEGYSIQYELNIGDLTAKLNKDNSISILDGKKEKFIIESPYMYDSNEAESDSIDVLLSKSNNGYILSYTPEYKWLIDEKVSYPITIDPTITISNDNTYQPIEDTFVTSSTPTRNKSTQPLITIGNTSWAYFNIKNLPVLPDNAVINKTTLSLFETINNDSVCTFIMHPLLRDTPVSPSFISEIKWINQPDLSEMEDVSLDCDLIKQNNRSICFDITYLAKYWYLDDSINHVLFVKPFDANVPDFTFASSEYTINPSKKPCLFIEYTVMTGIDDGFQFHTQNNNMAGNTYVNDYTGDLIVERTDMTSNGSMDEIKFYMGKTVNSPYNNCFGENVSINYYKTLQHDTFSSADFIINNADGHKEYIDNGEGHTIQQVSNSIITDTYSENNDTIVDTYSSDTLSINLPSTPVSERMYTLIQHTIKKENRNAEANNSTFNVAIEYLNDKIKSISDEIVKYNFTYDNGVLYTIARDTDYCGVDSNDLSIYSENFATIELYNIYEYSDINNNGKKLSITFGANDAAELYNTVDVSYEFNDQNEITQINDENNKVFKYQYTDGKVTQIQEAYKNDGNMVNGDYLIFDYDIEKTSISDGTNTYIEAFDSNGNILSTIDNNGNAVFFKNDEGLISSIKNSQQYIINKYEFDNSNELFFSSKNDNGNVSLNTNDRFSGSSSVKLSTQSRKKGEYTGRINGLSKYSSYTAAVWVKGKNNKVTLKLNNSQVDANFVLNQSLSSLNGWEQYICSIGTENSNYIDFNIVVQDLNNSAAITVYIDHMYIQHSSELTAENFINNGDFSNGLNDWYNENNDNTVNSNYNYIFENAVIPTADNKCLIMPGIYDGVNEVSQTVDVGALNAGDKFTFGAWMNAAFSLPERENREFSISVYAVSENGNNEEILGKITFPKYKNDWQYLLDEITIPEEIANSQNNYSYMRIKINYNYQLSQALIDGVFLSKEALYNFKPEPIDNSVDTSSVISYEYDDFGNTTESTETAVVDEIVKKIISQKTYSDNGCLITSTCNVFGPSIIGATNNTYYQFDYLGNTTWKYNSEDDVLGVYDYDNFNNLALIISFYENPNNSNQETIRVKYTYNGNRLEKIETGYLSPNANSFDFDEINTYVFSYDNWGNMHEIYINDMNNPYITYNYNNTKYHQMDSIEYINGQVIVYEYDAKGNLIEKADSETNTDNSLRYNYYYLDNGSCYGKEDLINGTVTSYQLGTTTVFDEDGNIISYVGYDCDGNTYEIACNNDIAISFSNNVQSATINNDTSNVSQEFDEFGRLSSEKYQIDGSNTYISKEYTYYGDGLHTTDKAYDTGNNGFITSSRKIRFISYYFVDSNNNKSLIDEYRYIYDTDGNIFSFSTSNDDDDFEHLDYMKVYGYNNNNMVNEEVSDFLSKDTIYEYHMGNITNISTYERLNGLFAPKTKTAECVLSYDGNNSGTALKDCLTDFDITLGNNTKNVDFSYDSMGNIIGVTNSSANEGEMISATLNWSRGNVLNGIDITNYHQAGNVTVNDAITYLYDDDNLRFNKQVNMGAAETTDINYTWIDGKLVGESIDCNGTVYNEQVNNNTVDNSGNYNIVILYDQNGNAYGFETLKTVSIQGVDTVEKQTYYYLKNAENTILAIIDTSGNKLVNYEYNAWGLPTVDYTEGNKYLMLLNPLVYRDAIYDTENGLYYINSKYYSPKIGRFISPNSPLEIKKNSAISGNLYAINEYNPVNVN